MSRKRNIEKPKWFKEARFGMFVHWGMYSVIGRGEWVKHQENIPDEEYAEYAPKFRAQKYNPEEWVKLAKEAGMKYLVLTARHHDGYCLFKTGTTDFNSVKIGPHRDLVAEYVKACRKYRMRIGIYYSLIDWSRPAAYQGPEKNPIGWQKLVEHIYAQVKELCTGYGKIDLLWYDGGFYLHGREICPVGAEDWQAKKLNAMVRKYQPDILINDRSGLPEDFDTPEKKMIPSKPGRPWEMCTTMNEHWGYFSRDTLCKSSKQLLHHLTGCVSKGGNYLLNVGPRPDGTIPKEAVRRLQKIGPWLKTNGEAIYGSGPETLDSGTAGVVTAKGKKIYLIVHWWPGRELCLPEVKVKVKSAYILSTGQKVILEPRGKRLILKGLPAKAPDPLSTVIVMKI